MTPIPLGILAISMGKKGYFIARLTDSSNTNGLNALSADADSSGNIWALFFSDNNYGGVGNHSNIVKLDYKGALLSQWTVGTNNAYKSIVVGPDQKLYVMGQHVSGYPVWARYTMSGGRDYGTYSSGLNPGFPVPAVDSSSNSYFCVSQGSQSHYIALDSSGNYKWGRYFTNGSYYTGTGSAAVDGIGNAYLKDYADGIIRKYNAAGTKLWGINGYGIGSQSNGFTGHCALAANSAGTRLMVLNGYYEHHGVTMLDASNGSLLWYYYMGYTTFYPKKSVVAKPDGSAYYVMHSMSNTALAVTKWDASGNIVWNRQITMNTGYGFQYSAPNFTIKLDANGDLILGINNGDAVGTSRYVYLMKIPADGSLTGSYAVGGFTVTYSVLSQSYTSYSAATGAESKTDYASNTVLSFASDVYNMNANSTISATTKVIP